MKNPFPVLCMIGTEKLFAVAKTRAVAMNISIEEALPMLSREERDAAIAEAMPPAAREAWELGKQRAKAVMARRRQASLMASYDTHAQVTPSVTAESRTMNLTPTEKQICQSLGITEVQWIEERARARSQHVSGIASALSPEQLTGARGVLARMNATLSDGERTVCQKMGIPEADYLEQRNIELQAQLPGWHDGMEHGLNAEEAAVCKQLGLTFDAYAAEKARGRAS